MLHVIIAACWAMFIAYAIADWLQPPPLAATAIGVLIYFIILGTMGEK